MSRDYRKEYQNYQGKPEQKKKRAMRNKARRALLREGKVRKGDDKDVDHKQPLALGGSNKPSNWRVRSEHANRSFRRTRSARMRRR